MWHKKKRRREEEEEKNERKERRERGREEKRTSVQYSITQIDTDKAIGRSTSFSSSSSSRIHNEVNSSEIEKKERERTKMHANSFVDHFRHHSKREREKTLTRRLAEDITMLSIDDNGFLSLFFFLSTIVWQIILKDDLARSLFVQGRMATDASKNVFLLTSCKSYLGNISERRLFAFIELYLSL